MEHLKLRDLCVIFAISVVKELRLQYPTEIIINDLGFLTTKGTEKIHRGHREF